MKNVSKDPLERAGELRDEGRPFALVTVVRTEAPTSARVGNRAFVHPDGAMEGWVGGGCIQPTARREGLAAMEAGEPRLVRITPDLGAEQANVRLARMTCASEGTADLYVEPVLPRPTLAVAGDSPVAEILGALAGTLGFRLVRASSAAKLSSESLPNPRDSWLVVATFGGFDEDAVEAGVRLGLPYVGLIASRRRAGSVLAELAARGLGGQELGVVRSPAGLPLGSGGHEGIALSVLAEVSSLRAKLRPGLAPSAPASPLAEAVDPVCGMTVEVARSQHAAEHEGVRYHFCCPGCKRRFEKTPGKFLDAEPVSDSA